nr:MAG TPA: hypothetical protein [Caudoviricetes sp.]
MSSFLCNCILYHFRLWNGTNFCKEVKYVFIFI